MKQAPSPLVNGFMRTFPAILWESAGGSTDCWLPLLRIMNVCTLTS